jgi:RNase adapter protein RapZ
MSYGRKYGAGVEMDGREPDRVFNITTVPNPKNSVRKKQTGLHRRLQKELWSLPRAVSNYEKILHECRKQVQSTASGASCAVNIAVGCHSGKHRSVAFVERLKEDLADLARIHAIHRDVERTSERRRKDGRTSEKRRG